MRKQIKYLVIHCTATPDGMEVTPDDIIGWHTQPKPKGRGWSKVGYGMMIDLKGRIHFFTKSNLDDFVDQWEITNGVAGINEVSYHFVYVGGCGNAYQNGKGLPAKDTRNKEQLETMRNFVLGYVQQHKNVKVAGHYHFDNKKACPSFDVEKWCLSIGLNKKNVL